MWSLYHRYLRNVDVGTIIFHEFCLFFLCSFSSSRSESWTWLIAAVLKMLYQPQRTYSTEAVFKLHEVFHEPLRSSWIKFLNVDITSMKSVFVCFKHFDDVHLNKEDKGTRLNMHLNPIQQARICYTNSVPRKPPKISISWWGRQQK